VAITMEEHAEAIKAVIDSAEADGFAFAINNECCGCGDISVEIMKADQWEADMGTDAAIVVLGERRR
jgi:hypothetical protein